MSNPSRQTTRFSTTSTLVAALLALTLSAGSSQAAPADRTADNGSFSLTKLVRDLFGDSWLFQDEAENRAEDEILFENAVSRSELDSEIEVDPPHNFIATPPEKQAPITEQR